LIPWTTSSRYCINSGWSSGDIREAGLHGRPRCLRDPTDEDNDSWDRAVIGLRCRRVSPGESSLLITAPSAFIASSGFGDNSCGSPPPNRPVNMSILTQVPEEISIYCKGGSLTKTFDPDVLK
jgi:hypothetical protein